MSTKLRPVLKTRYGRDNEPLRVPIANLLQDPLAQSSLSNDFASGVSSITVNNIYGFAINQILFIGNPNNSNSEFIKTHSATTPTGSTITLASNTVHAHSNSDYVRVVLYDQVEFSSAVSLTGSKVVLTTVNLDVQGETKYNDDSITTGYYYARFKNSITGVYSAYSDPLPMGNYAYNTARYIIDSALADINKATSKIFSDEYGFMQINNCQLDVMKQLKRWSWMKVYGATYPAQVGTWKVALPSDVDDTNTNKSIENLTIKDTGNLIWIDKDQWNNITADIIWTTLSQTLNIGDSTIVLASSNGFGDTGNVIIGGKTFSFTANDTSTGTLTLSTVSAYGFPVGQDAFQNPETGTPRYVTYFDGYLWHYPVLDETYDGFNYVMDYYSTLTPITADSDTIVVPDANMVQMYLQWKYLKRMNGGQEDDASMEAYQNYIAARNKLKQTEVSGVRIVMKPRFNDYNRLMSEEGDSKFTRTQGYWPTNY